LQHPLSLSSFESKDSSEDFSNLEACEKDNREIIALNQQTSQLLGHEVDREMMLF
jgi:hypothetical protein